MSNKNPGKNVDVELMKVEETKMVHKDNGKTPSTKYKHVFWTYHVRIVDLDTGEEIKRYCNYEIFNKLLGADVDARKVIAGFKEIALFDYKKKNDSWKHKKKKEKK